MSLFFDQDGCVIAMQPEIGPSNEGELCAAFADSAANAHQEVDIHLDSCNKPAEIQTVDVPSYNAVDEAPLAAQTSVSLPDSVGIQCCEPDGAQGAKLEPSVIDTEAPQAVQVDKAVAGRKRKRKSNANGAADGWDYFCSVCKQLHVNAATLKSVTDAVINAADAVVGPDGGALEQSLANDVSEFTDKMLACEGGCKRSFHFLCLKLPFDEMQRLVSSSDPWMCVDCVENTHACHFCKERGDKPVQAIVRWRQLYSINDIAFVDKRLKELYENQQSIDGKGPVASRILESRPSRAARNAHAKTSSSSAVASAVSVPDKWIFNVDEVSDRIRRFIFILRAACIDPRLPAIAALQVLQQQTAGKQEHMGYLCNTLLRGFRQWYGKTFLSAGISEEHRAANLLQAAEYLGLTDLTEGEANVYDVCPGASVYADAMEMEYAVKACQEEFVVSALRMQQSSDTASADDDSIHVSVLKHVDFPAVDALPLSCTTNSSDMPSQCCLPIAGAPSHLLGLPWHGTHRCAANNGKGKGQCGKHFHYACLRYLSDLAVIEADIRRCRSLFKSGANGKDIQRMLQYVRADDAVQCGAFDAWLLEANHIMCCAEALVMGGDESVLIDKSIRHNSFTGVSGITPALTLAVLLGVDHPSVRLVLRPSFPSVLFTLPGVLPSLPATMRLINPQTSSWNGLQPRWLCPFMGTAFMCAGHFCDACENGEFSIPAQMFPEFFDPENAITTLSSAPLASLGNDTSRWTYGGYRECTRDHVYHLESSEVDELSCCKRIRNEGGEEIGNVPDLGTLRDADLAKSLKKYGTRKPLRVCMVCSRAYHDKCLPPSGWAINEYAALCTAHAGHPLPGESDTTFPSDIKCGFDASNVSDNAWLEFGGTGLSEKLKLLPLQPPPLDIADTDDPRHFRCPKTFFSELSGKPPAWTNIKKNVYLTKVRPEWPEGDVCTCSLRGSQCDDACVNRMLRVECFGDASSSESARINCSIGVNCGNRALQQRDIPPLDVVMTPGKGWGVLAGADIAAGSFVIEYIGEIIDEETQNARMEECDAKGEVHYYMMEIDSNQIIDARHKSNMARFINHSCEPNCELQRWNVEGYTRIGIFALRDIARGEEVSYDYQFFTALKTACYCGAEKCRGLLGANLAKANSSSSKQKQARSSKK